MIFRTFLFTFFDHQMEISFGQLIQEFWRHRDEHIIGNKSQQV